MRKCICFIHLFLVLPVIVSSQIATPVVKADETMIIEMNEALSNKTAPQIISSVTIMDAREDTSSLGFYIPKTDKVLKICFAKKTSDEIAIWTKRYLGLSDATTKGDILFGVIKKLRISEEATPKTFDNGHQGQAKNGWDKGVLIKMEYFLKRDSFYYPLYRFDSLMIYEGEIKSKAGEFVSASVESSLQKVFSLNFSNLFTKAPKLTFEKINSKIEEGNRLPILSASQYKKGVYASFDEFKGNAPSLTDYEFKAGKLGDVLYVKKDSSEYPDRTAWGFCDGKNIYINSADKFSQLIQSGNTFYFKGIKSITKTLRVELMYASVLNLLDNTVRKKSHFNANPKYYQIDMETGDIY